ncbi:MAG: helix-turn-helix transcriptional regulator [Clostridia bacterium]|nr:helix-turn-helix transcriptional regulator [Clostridia bacterium]
MCEYGKIRIKLRSVIEKNNITRYQLSKMTSTRFEVVNKWYNGEVERIDSDVLARFCFVLNCKVEDLIEYEG